MILRALYDYYQRAANLAPQGTEYKEIAFVIVIDGEGTFLRLDDMRGEKGKGAKTYLVAKGHRSGTTPKPYLYWDNLEYVCHYCKDSSPKAQAKALRNHAALVSRYAQIAKQFPDNEAFQAVSRFYEREQLQDLYAHPLWQEVLKKPTVNISFRLQGCTSIVAEDKVLPTLADAQPDEAAQDSQQIICLVTGKRGKLAELHTATPIQGSQAIAKLVSFQVKKGYDSYGHEQGANAPVSKEAEACYTTALKQLLGKDSRNKFVIGSRTFLFWASSHSPAARAMEESMCRLFGHADTTDDPNQRVDLVKDTFKAIYSGTTVSRAEDRFFFLGLAPNAARIAVVYWDEAPLRLFAGKMLAHFADTEIQDSRSAKPYQGLYQMLSAVVLKGKVADAPPNLPEAVLASILQRTPYPYSLLMACISRIRAEQSVGRTRAAILKGYLNRTNNSNNHIKPLQPMLDKENNNQGYLCGRLFAALEYLQECAQGQATIRQRYITSASTTPAAVFPTLLCLSVHHEEKLPKSRQVFMEKVKTEIMQKMTTDGFPTTLDITDQGRFMVGYYHQRQHFYSPKEDTTDNEQTNTIE